MTITEVDSGCKHLVASNEMPVSLMRMIYLLGQKFWIFKMIPGSPIQGWNRAILIRQGWARGETERLSQVGPGIPLGTETLVRCIHGT